MMNEVVNVLWGYCCGVSAGVFSMFSCRHSWNLRLRLTEPDSHMPANPIHVLRPKFILSWHSTIATSVVAVRMVGRNEVQCHILQKMRSGTQNWSLPIARMLGNS